MIVGDLLDAPVRTHDGGAVGFVVDVRLTLELTGEAPEASGSGERDREHAGDETLADRQGRSDAVGRADVVGLLVSPRAGGSFLGYERTDVRAPWPIAQLVRWRHRGTFLVRWEDVAAVDDGVVRLAAGFRRRDPGLGPHGRSSS